MSQIVFIGLAITSSWGNGHATTYRSLIKGLHRCGHRVLFLERDQPWYAQNRDAPSLPYCETQLYEDLDDLRRRLRPCVREADAVIVGSYVPDGRDVCDWVLEEAAGVRAFYDIDTPVTLARLRAEECGYLCAEHIAEFDLMLSFTGGPTLGQLQREFGARRAAALYCSVDIDEYRPRDIARDLELGYMGTYSEDRQTGLESLLNEPARRLPGRQFALVGAQYPRSLCWPANVRRTHHLAPNEHALFYNRQRYTLNVTRADMRLAGWSPSVRLFEAAACGTPILSDAWPGLEEVLVPGEEILVVHSGEDVVEILEGTSEVQRTRIAQAARERVLAAHSSLHRAVQLERSLQLEGTSARPGPRACGPEPPPLRSCAAMCSDEAWR